jgi:hypothetical protein
MHHHYKKKFLSPYTLITLVKIPEDDNFAGTYSNKLIIKLHIPRSQKKMYTHFNERKLYVGVYIFLAGPVYICAFVGACTVCEPYRYLLLHSCQFPSIMLVHATCNRH